MKFKKIESDFYFTICDRLTRLEPACIRYKKLTDTIISKYYTDCDIKKYSEMQRIELALNIINSSCDKSDYDENLRLLFKLLEEKYFICNEESYQYLSYRFNLFNLIANLKTENNNKKNILWLKNICKNNDLLINVEKNIEKLSPVKKIILCEGQTEFILLETLFKLFDYDFNKNGVYILPAGGKNQVIRQYYKIIEYCKIPIFILMDKDAEGIKYLITSKLRDIDKLYIINSGEFEDLIPVNTVISTLNYVYINDYNCNIADFSNELKMAKNIEYIHKKYGFGEFKKAVFAKNLNSYINNYSKKDDFINSEIVDIVKNFINF